MFVIAFIMAIHEAGVRPIVYHGLAGVETARVGRTHFEFHSGKALRRSVEAVVVLVDKEYPKICAFRGVTEYIAAMQSIGWDLTKGHVHP